MKQGMQQEFGGNRPVVAGRRGRALLAVAIALVCLGTAVPASQAALPAWKLLAAAGPTNLPPRQSEVQRVTVEAEGGTFQLGAKAGEGVVTPIVNYGEVEVEEGSPVATIKSAEGTGFQVGDRIQGGAVPFEGETFVVACSADCKTPGTTVTYSNAAVESSTEAFVIDYAREATVLEGEIAVGDELRASEEEIFSRGTDVTAVSGPTIGLSKPPTEKCFFCEGVETTIIQKTPPIASDAAPATVQGVLEAVPALGAGSVVVEGGPGGDAEHPYTVNFGGVDGKSPLADQDVEPLISDGDALVGQHAAARVFTTVPGGPGTGEISIDPANIGGAPTAGKYTVELGPLPEGVVTRAAASGENWTCSGAGQEKNATCSSTFSVSELNPATNIIVPIEVTSAAASEGTVPVTISGGGATSDSILVPLRISRSPVKAGIAAFWAGSFDADGRPEAQAGAHPYSSSTYFLLNTMRLPNGHVITAGEPKAVLADLPPGFSGNPVVTPRCPQSQLVPLNPISSPLCTTNSNVGNFAGVLNSFGSSSPATTARIWNDIPPTGYAAEFTTEVGSPRQNLLASVKSSEDFGIRISALSISNFARVFGAFAVLRGSPPGAEGKPFLSNATSCAENAREAPVVGARVDTWQEPKFSLTATASVPAVTNCAALQFTPGFSFQPMVATGSSGTGATAALHISQEGLTDPAKLAPPDLKKAVVTLPAGLTLNPSSANGLEACSEDQIGFLGNGSFSNPDNFNEEAPSCPDGSKLGTVEVTTPLLEEELNGTIYLAEQEKNPFGSLLALYLAIESPRFGLQIKLAGKVDLDPTTGQLTATFDHNPQLAFEDLRLVFRGGGPRSEFATPEVCGHYATTGSLEPWSAPESGPPAQIQESGFDVGSNCAPSADKRPFSPTFEAGTTDTQAGADSPLVIKVDRKDGEQELKTLDFTLPKGLLAKLAGIPYCPEGAIQNAEGKSGKEEQASASCPAASQIGTVDTAAGVGSEPFHVGGKVYLAGPYEGAPLSSVVVTPAVAGPLDLGDVVVRAPLYVDPETAEVTAKSNPIPAILRGIPLKVRSVAIDLGRSNFTLNPTSCSVMLATASIAGSSGATASPSNRFQVGGCDKLKFKPQLKLSLKGSIKHAGHPALRAVLTYPKKGAYANIRRAQVNLPHSEFIDQGNLDKTCTRPVLLEGKCTKRSIYGRAKAWTPLLDKPLEGPVYLVGGYGYKLPALVAELNGQIRVVLKGKVDSGPNKGIRNTFEAVPDAPVSRFMLQLKGGPKYSLLENSENLCAKPQQAIARFTAQNGLVDQYKPLIANQCGKKRGKKGDKKSRKGNTAKKH